MNKLKLNSKEREIINKVMNDEKEALYEVLRDIYKDDVKILQIAHLYDLDPDNETHISIIKMLMGINIVMNVHHRDKSLTDVAYAQLNKAIIDVTNLAFNTNINIIDMCDKMGRMTALED